MLNLSIRTRFALACVVLSVGSALVVVVWAYRHLTEERVATVEKNFRSEMGRLILRLDNTFRAAERDLLILTHLPPIHGLGRTLLYSGWDARDQSTEQQWRDRLATIFTSMLENRNHYYQIRLIGTGDGGREMVRVDRHGDGSLRRIENLQRKAGEPYFAPSIELKEGDVYYSEITLNREWGVVDPSNIPTLRISAPVFDERGGIYGFLIINIDYKALMLSMTSGTVRDYSSYLIDEAGNYLELSAQRGGLRFVYSGLKGETPEILNTLANQRDSTSFYYSDAEDNEHFVVTASDEVSLQTRNLNLRLVISMEKAVLLAPLRDFQHTLIIIAVVLIAVCGLIAYFLSAWLLRPVYQTIDALGHYASGKLNELPEVRDDTLQKLSATNEQAVRSLLESSRSGILALHRYQVIFEIVVEGLISIDDRGIVESMNPAAERMFGYREDEVVGQNVNILMPEPYHSEHDTYLQNYQRTGVRKIIGIDREVAGRRKDGSIFPIQLAVSEGRDQNRAFYIGSVSDITERKRWENELKESLQALEVRNQELNDFAYIASHDLREPMRGLQLHAQKLLKNCAAELDEDANRRLQRINELANRLQLLVSDLLYFSRLGREEVEFVEVDLNEVVSAVIKSLGEYISERNATVTVLNTLPSLPCDRSKVDSIFNNLITNALKYNEREEKRVAIDCLQNVEHENRVYSHVIVVADNGIGIDEQFYADIFRMFKRLNAEQEFGYGTGAGLAFVSKSIEMHGGQIWVESTPGEGSRFYFSLSQT